MLLAATASPAPGEVEETPSGPVVALDVEQAAEPLGTIKMVLLPDKAPISVENFLGYLRAGHYDGTVFHRVMPNFMIQGGGYTPEMEEKPQRPPIRNEARNQVRNSRGTVAMARTNDPDSATSEFFINVRDNHNLDFGIGGAGYAVFAQVIEGMEVVDRMAQTPTTRRGVHETTPTRPVVITRAYEVVPSAPPPAPPPAPDAPPR